MSWNLLSSTFASTTASVSTLAVTPPAVAIGQLIIVGISGFHPTVTPTVTDTLGNTYTKAIVESAANPNSSIYYTVVTAPGTPIITYTPGSPNFMALNVDVWSCAGKISASTPVGGTNTSTTASSGNVTFGSPGNYLLYGTAMSLFATGSWTAGSGFTATCNQTGVASEYESLITEYMLTTSASSPLAATATLPSNQWCMCGMAFLEAPGMPYHLLFNASNYSLMGTP